MPVIELTLDATQLILGSICYLLTIVKILIIVSFNADTSLIMEQKFGGY
jgi:hypothetical protein